MSEDAQDTAREEYLRAHLKKHYGVSVARLERLDRGVVSLSLEDGRHWIARVFAPTRPLNHVQGDAEVLQFLEQQGFPAERCADPQPVSVLAGRSILVTEYLEHTTPDPGEPTLTAFGALLGRLNALPATEGALARQAGALHHYVRGGGSLQAELAAAASWLEAIEDRVPKATRARYDVLREQIASADPGLDLPQALIHPDPVLKNLLSTSSGPVLIDWTGAGRGSRLAPLALLLWSGAFTQTRWSPRRVDAVVAGYRAHIQPEERELARLAGVMRVRPLVFACWRLRHALLAGKEPDGSEWWWPSEALFQAIAARAVTAFQR